MIFVTVGAQMPFDRLIKTVDQWARNEKRDDVFAQIGLSDYRPKNMRWTHFLSMEEYMRHSEESKAIISHAGTGSIITALQLGKPILIMPRQAKLRETRNDHQTATMEQFQRFSSVSVAKSEAELLEKLKNIDNLTGYKTINQHASPELINTIRKFINEG